MAHVGSISNFDESVEDFDSYCSRIEFYFVANSIKEDKKKAVFVTLLGPKVFSLLQNLISPKTPHDCSYNELVTTLKQHYKPKVVIVYERFKFHTRRQGQGETISDFVAGLKSSARTCDFGDMLDDMLRDRFVVGLLSEDTQRILLTEPDLTFNRAVTVAAARETAESEVREMGRKDFNVNAIQQKSTNFNKSKNVPSSTKPKPFKPCYGCGRQHWRKDCPFLNVECFQCHKKGHIKKMCKNFSSGNSPQKVQMKRSNSSSQDNHLQRTKSLHTAFVEADNSQAGKSMRDWEVYEDFIFQVSSSKPCVDPLVRDVYINGFAIKMEIDTGAARSLMCRAAYDNVPKGYLPDIKQSTVVLHAYGGSPLSVLGEIEVNVSLTAAGPLKVVKIVVVEGTGPCLMGRDLLSALDVQEISINSLSSLDVKKKFPDLFAPGLGCYQGHKFSICVDPNVSPKYCSSRSLPYALKPKVEAELIRLEAEGIIVPIEHSEWAAAIVPVLKPDGSVRICGDYKLTVNRAVKLDAYPIPRMEDLFTSLSGGCYFTKLDMSQAYSQLPLDEESQKYTVINTHKGLFQYTRLPFGVSSAPGMFQRVIEQLVGNFPGVLCYLDDILVTGSTKVEHDNRLVQVLTVLQEKGLRLRADKCIFCTKEVSYLGYTVDGTGIRPDAKKVAAIIDAPSPKDIKQLQAFLGSLGFYRRFLSNLSSLLEPLNRLLRAGVSWEWGLEQQQSFAKAKNLLANSKALVIFNEKIPIVLITDSSPYGVGAVLCHKIDGQERPITFASRTLSAAERKYSQLEKEALALVYGVKKFHNYLWGQKFSVITDHKPLLGIFSPKKPIPTMASGRVQRWCLILQAYQFDLFHRSGSVLGLADALSRLPICENEGNDSVPILGEWISLINFLDFSPVTAHMVSQNSRTDPLIAKVIRYCESGWHTVVREPELDPFYSRRDELSLEGGCLLWGARIVIPQRLRKLLMDELHAGHVGSTRMKELARSYFWWPGLDKELEQVVANCSVCLQKQPAPPRAELHPWEWPTKPWHRIHVDYAGPIKNKYYLIIVDAHSKWLEVFPCAGPSATATIKHLRHCFSHFGLPVSLVSDNGPCFVSEQFKMFLKENGVRHITTAIYKPSTNGLAERAVRSFKLGLSTSKDDVDVFLDKFLFRYRITPHATTGITPAELMFKRKLRCRFDLLFPMDRLTDRVLGKQQSQCKLKPSHRRLSLVPGDPVAARNYASGPKWLPAIVQRQTGPVSYKCALPDGSTVRRHQDQILTRRSIVPSTAASFSPFSEHTQVPSSPISVESRDALPCADRCLPVSKESNLTPSVLGAPRRSGRVCRPVVRLNL